MEKSENSFENSSKLAAQVESHCQYLTFIKHNISQRTQVARSSFKVLEMYLKDRRCKLNTQGLLQLIVELAYFLYACKTYQVAPAIDINSDIRVQEASWRSVEKRFSVVIWYKIDENPLQDGDLMQLFIDFVQYIREKLDDYLAYRTSERQGSQQQIQQQQALDLFYRQLEMLVGCNYFQEHESHFFLCLQQTALFYQISMMYLIKNCSILDFIKTDESKLSQFRHSKVRDESLAVQYNKQKDKNNNDEETLTIKEKEIQNNICQFFKGINEKSYFYILSKNEKDQTYRVKFTYNLHERQKYAFQQMIQSMQGANVFRNDSKRLMDCRRQSSQLDFYIQYSSQKNHICVRLYNLYLISNNESLDFHLFQSNVFTHEYINISIELSQPKIKGIEYGKKKVITFKGTSSFELKEPPLERILLLMDVTMIASKIYEPELMVKNASNRSKDFQRLSIISKKISHYTKLFLKCAKKIYSQ